jgi:hypothetical protein
MSTQHAGLSAERWSSFSFGQQVLMIANEFHRASKLVAPADAGRRRTALERVYALADLTIATSSEPARRRELLRWREQLGFVYLSPAPDAAADHRLLRVLLQLSPEAAPQVPLVAAT